jgi:ABC-type glutathione transport system ATPase component
LTTTESATTRDLSISVTNSEGGALVCLSGRVSVDSSPDLRDRIAMLYKGSFLAVGTKDEIRASQHPRIRQFLDGVPDNTAPKREAEEYFEEYIQSPAPSARQSRRHPLLTLSRLSPIASGKTY